MSKVYRRLSYAEPAISMRTFNSYDEALTFARSVGAGRPNRKVCPDALRWVVPVVNLSPAPATFAAYCELPRPVVPASVVQAVVAELPDIAKTLRMSDLERDTMPQPPMAPQVLPKPDPVRIPSPTAGAPAKAHSGPAKQFGNRTPLNGLALHGFKASRALA